MRETRSRLASLSFLIFRELGNENEGGREGGRAGDAALRFPPQSVSVRLSA